MPESLRNIETESYTLNGLKYSNYVFKVNKSAILICNTPNVIEFLLIETIYKINNSNIFYGPVFETFTELESKIQLAPVNRYCDQTLLALENFHCYEVYKDACGSFIVPYFLLGL